MSVVLKLFDKIYVNKRLYIFTSSSEEENLFLWFLLVMMFKCIMCELYHKTSVFKDYNTDFKK